MFTQTWKKYLPAIAILIKRSVAGDQALSMNHTDFERAASGRKIKFSFSQLQLNKGKLNTSIQQAPLAKELAIVLQEDAAAFKLINNLELEFSMGRDFVLHIKNNSTTIEQEETALQDETEPVSENVAE